MVMAMRARNVKKPDHDALCDGLALAWGATTLDFAGIAAKPGLGPRF